LQRLPRDQSALQRTEARVQSVDELVPREGLALRERGREVGPPLRGQSLHKRDGKLDAMLVRGELVVVVVELALQLAKPLVHAEAGLTTELRRRRNLRQLGPDGCSGRGGCVGSGLLLLLR